MIDIPTESLIELREGIETAQAALTKAVTTLASLIPEPAMKRLTFDVLAERRWP
jgi:hypothetical protein